MKILQIRGRNLASLAGDFNLDFESGPLAEAGLFAIAGPTGGWRQLGCPVDDNYPGRFLPVPGRSGRRGLS